MSNLNIDQFIALLPKLIRENDAVKGAILSALSGVVATKEDIKELIREMDKRFESMDKRFEAMQIQMDKRFESMDKRFEAMQIQMDKRFEAMQIQMDKRFDAVDKRFEAMDKRIDQGFKKVYRRLDEISIGADVSFELFCKSMIKTLFKAEQIQIPYIESGRHFKDSSHIVFPGSTDIEIDLFCPDPAIMGEVTYRVKDLQKIQTFIQKIQFMENQIFHQPARKFFCALEIDSSIYFEVQKLATQHQIQVISKELKV
ncbi:MAG: hypothetical protein ACTSVL_12625 [Promethearchaeota archaeon]